MKSPHALIGAIICFCFPVIIASVMNWKQIQPYVVVDPTTAEGQVVYLYAPG